MLIEYFNENLFMKI